MDKKTLIDFIDSYMSEKPTLDEIDGAIRPAMKKYKSIIEREGDANGKRRTEEYFAQLLVEEIRQRRFCELTFAVYEEQYGAKKMSAAKADAQTQHTNHIIDIPISQGVTLNFIFEGAF